MTGISRSSMIAVLLAAGTIFAAPAGAFEVTNVNLTQEDVGGVIGRVVQEANARGTPATIVVEDRLGGVLAIYAMAGAPATFPIENNPRGANTQLDGIALPATAEAISMAGTAAFLSSAEGNAFTTATASQIIQDHFDPGTRFAPSGPLFGVQFSSLPCSDLNVRGSTADPSTLTRGPHRLPLGLAGSPGGLPLYKNGQLVGAVGVKAVGPYRVVEDIHDNIQFPDEILALAGTITLDTPTEIRADRIQAGGLSLRYANATPSQFKTNPFKAKPFAQLPASQGSLVSLPTYFDATGGIRAGVVYGTAASGLMPVHLPFIHALQTPFALVDGQGNLRFPAMAGFGPGALTLEEVQTLQAQTFENAINMRAQIRNPPGSTLAVTMSFVDVNGTVIGSLTIPDAPNFGIDVSLQKARSVLQMSSKQAGAELTAGGFGSFVNQTNAFFGFSVLSSGTAFSDRAIGNIDRDTYPDGVDNTRNGPLSLPASLQTPFSDGFQEALIINNLVQHAQFLTGASPTDTPAFCTTVPAPEGSPTGKPILSDGLQIFPGGFPIYRGNQLVGALGISGDGVDQDDMIAFIGIFLGGQVLHNGVGNAPFGIRVDRLVPVQQQARTRYVQCPFSPYVNNDTQDVCTNK
jgi:uncharacterized protein GlcG (DUF336 family)